jgi:hypothetical protein
MTDKDVDGGKKYNTAAKRKEVRERLAPILEGLKKRFKDPKDFLSKEMMQMVHALNAEVLPTIQFERNWNDHFHLIDAIIEANNVEALLYKIKYRKLGRMGIVLYTEWVDDMPEADRSCSGDINPLAILLAANVKTLFRDLSISIKPTCFSGKGDETEILFQ